MRSSVEAFEFGCSIGCFIALYALSVGAEMYLMSGCAGSVRQAYWLASPASCHGKLASLWPYGADTVSWLPASLGCMVVWQMNHLLYIGCTFDL
jgi:hypothetical protein